MITLLIFLMCLIGGIYNLCIGQLADAAILLGFCGVFVLIARWIGGHKKQTAEFLNWIKSKQEDLKKGWAFYRGQKITLTTEVTQYLGCISLGIVTIRFRSRYLFVGQGNTGIWCLFTGITLWMGWWGIPWGFIFTPQALYRNCRSGYRQTVGQLLAQVDEELAELNKRPSKLSTILKEARAETHA
jgi:hypothetical protein